MITLAAWGIAWGIRATKRKLSFNISMVWCGREAPQSCVMLLHNAPTRPYSLKGLGGFVCHPDPCRTTPTQQRLGDHLGDRSRNKLTSIGVKKAGDGKLFDGGGLTLVKRGPSGNWVFRYSHLGKRREMGLGSWPTLPLSAARESRDKWASVLAGNQDPIAVRDAENAAQVDHRDRDDPTFADAVQMVFEARKATLRGGGDRGRWLSPLTSHVIPSIGRKRISEIHQRDIKDTLSPIWKTKHPTATKAIGRTRIVFEKMRLMGYECDPFTVDAAREMLGHVDHKTIPTPSTDWREMPALYARLDSGSTVDQALRFMMLTIVRGSAAVGARFSEFDGGIWTVPADRIKGQEGKVQDFRVPLSAPAVGIVKEQSAMFDRYLFESYMGRAVSLNGLEERLLRIGENGRPHGFRSSFRTWATDNDACGWEVSETVLGHSIGNKVERAYNRSDLLERRATAMDAWAAHVTGARSAKIVSVK